MSSLAAQLNAAKAEGNDHFKRQEWGEAFQAYTRGIDMGLASLEPTIFLGSRCESDPQPDVAALATLYGNRAAAGLKLGRLEQVLHDTGQVQALVVYRGCSAAAPAMHLSLKALYGKAWARRGEAYQRLGNFMQAQVNLMKAGRALGNARDLPLACATLCKANTYPCQYGRFGLPPAPAPRSSSCIEGVRSRKLACRLPSNKCAFMSVVAWSGRLWCFGGSSVDMTEMFEAATGNLLVIDPRDESLREVNVKEDPSSMKWWGLPEAPSPRSRHTAVVWRGSMYVFGAGNRISFDPEDGLDFPPREDVSSSDQTTLEEGRTVWRLDLEGLPLQWERLYVSSGPAPFLRGGHVAVVWGQRMIIHGGEASDSLDEVGDVWAFDLVHHRWQRLAASPQPRSTRDLDLVPQAPEARHQHAAWMWEDTNNGNGSGRGGSNGGEAWMYIFGGSSAALSEARRNSGGDLSMPGHDFDFPDMWRFSLNRYKPGGNTPVGRFEAGYTITPKGTFLLAGGYSTTVCTLEPSDTPRAAYASSYLSDVFEYDPKSNYWRMARTADMQGPLGPERAACPAAFLDGQLFVVGGYVGQETPTARRDVLAIRLKACAHCGAERGLDSKLYHCEQCKVAGRSYYFCSRQCMKEDWHVHKIVCSPKGILP